MPVGRVKWYDKAKGYGFIESPEGDVFFHFSDIQMEGFKALAEDQRVSYKMQRTSEGLKAKTVVPLDHRATVRRAARYRNLTVMRVKPGSEKEFDRFITQVPAWFDEFEQDLGMRRIGTWRVGQDAIRLTESDRPLEQTMQAANENPKWENYQQWIRDLTEMLEGEPRLMSPVLPEEKIATDDDQEEQPPQEDQPETEADESLE